jgi:dihydroxy-acid dehydratase
MGQALEQMEKFTRALNKSHLIAAGFSYADLQKPIIAIANSWNEFNHGHIAQRGLAEEVKKGIRQAGGTPMEFSAPGPCDGLAVGNDGMHYILPTRELVANVVEATLRGHPVFDGLLLISSCDKINPGMLIAAARLNMPAIHLAGGPSIPAISFAESRALRRDFLEGRLGEQELAEKNARLYATAGSCPYIGTANTMTAMAEALGMALPGSSLAPAESERRRQYAFRSGEQIVRLVQMNLTSSQVMTLPAFQNSIRVAAALGGSSNYVIHIIAIAARAGIHLSLEDIDWLNCTTPLLAEISPNGPHSVVDLDKAGGIPAVMQELSPLLDLDVMTVTGRTLRENLMGIPAPDRAVIHPLQHPVNPEGGMVVLYGNLAPGGAIVKRSAVPPQLHHFEGPARVFESEQACIQAMDGGLVRDGDVLVVRCEGPRGGPGMREMHRLSNRLKALLKQVALITDGRFSGADSGLMIGHVTPEALEGGPLGVVQDGDRIVIDLTAKTLSLRVSAAELKRRLAAFIPQPRSIDSELLRHYRDEVGCAAEGAIW